jgi:hypothetical protein
MNWYKGAVSSRRVVSEARKIMDGVLKPNEALSGVEIEVVDLV